MRISVRKAASFLNAGAVVAVPTETVYGLAASISKPEAIKRIFFLKGRPSSNPLIIHVSSQEEIEKYVKRLPENFKQLAKAFWPGPMTLVLNVEVEKVPSIVRAGLTTAAFRIPQHPIAHKLLEMTGPLVMPSANLSGTPSATRAIHVEKDFGEDFPVLNGEACRVGLESTILIYLDDRWSIIRQGALTAAAFEAVLGYIPHIKGNENRKTPICPGQLFRHYAPKSELILSHECSKAKKAVVLGFTDRRYHHSCQVIPLGALSNPAEVAENLYKALRFLDEEQITKALVDVDFPVEGLLEIILERLTKAAAGSIEKK